MQVNNGGQTSNCRGEDFAWSEPAIWLTSSCRGAKRQMAASRMSDDGNAAKIQVDLAGCEYGEVIDGRRNVLHRTGPTAARAANPAVFNIPHGIAARSKIGSYG